jgi:hypothetical protein
MTRPNQIASGNGEVALLFQSARSCRAVPELLRSADMLTTPQ